MKIISLILILFALTGCAATNSRTESNRSEFVQKMEVLPVELVLEQWHFAASQGLFDMYFGLMTPDAIFMGTDESERWNIDQFKGYAREPFADGDGWTYTPRKDGRFVVLSDDKQTAWVDELLDNEKYGVLRGTSVLVKVGDDWKIAHYSLTFLVPNDKAKGVVELIAED
ncbi:MAG: nuclear transport factor 2 family protein [Phycisphaerales bacterium]|nr:nuclear transport factor 2 family protein [Phycisphaerales bacterium]